MELLRCYLMDKAILTPFISTWNSALTTFRKETDDGEELELHGFEVAALMNLVMCVRRLRRFRCQYIILNYSPHIFCTADTALTRRSKKPQL